MHDDRVSVFDAEGSRYVLAGGNVRQMIAILCCMFRRAALGGGVISLLFWCTFGRAAIGGRVISLTF